MKIAAVTIVRDSEKFIIPHLKMYKGVDRNIVLFPTKPITGGANGHSDNPDNSLALIEKYCPEVEVFKTDISTWGAELFNKALELASDCDKVVTLHADVILTDDNWNKLLNFLKITDYDVYKADMTKCWINYYHDFEHGARNCLDIEPIAAKSTVRYANFYTVPQQTKVYTIDWPFFTAHHFTGWKPPATTKEWMKENENWQKWTICPKEIRDKFNENSH